MSLLEAINNGDLVQVLAIINSGIGTKQVELEGELLLQSALLAENLKIAKTLIEAGASPDWEGLGKELLETAIMEADTELVKVLVDAGANVNARDEDGNTPLMSAAAIGSLDIVQILVESKAEVNVVSEHGDFALLSAVINEHQEVFNYLAPLTSLELREKLPLV